MTEDARTRGPSATRRAAFAGMAAIGASALLGRELTAQDATPVAGPVAGLGAWGDRLAMLDPAVITELVLGEPVEPVRNIALVARETAFVEEGNLPLHEEVVGEVSLGTESTATGEFEVGTGTMYITSDLGIARLLLSSVEIDERPQRSAWKVPFAGLDARWEVVGENGTSILVQAGPVVVLGRDRFLADGAYNHLMDGIRNVLENTAHVLYHLYAATKDELGVD